MNGERVNPRLLQFIHESPPRIRGEWQLGLLADSEPPALTDDEFNAAMKKLRKQTYDPPQPKRNTWKRRGLFGNRNSSSSSNNIIHEIKIEKNEEDKQCAICLESFVPKEQVLMTPCNHMFHSKCIVPWVRSHGRCPVCRFKLYEKKETVQGQNYRNYSNNSVNIYEDDLALDLINLLRAMEEAFMWMHLT
ncbi:RING-H2 finger protein ATL78-like [Phalaenopsis equestris]|uniref:RING-H2 finger protein ATL78-like n=1 Tax=Phalaenopsis equestris TaxID=78828 RepID=UPI0009E3227F|nr:RING-H2 finger protein ATL78-like [Phalaenopsis equestris]